MLGTSAYKNLPFTGPFQSTFPWYRQRSSFGATSGVFQFSGTDGDASQAAHRSNFGVHEIDESGEVVAHRLADGTQSTSKDKLEDAHAWKVEFAHDVFNNHCSNHEHDCTETCVKYVKKKLEAKQSLRSNKVPSCRFWFFRVKKLQIMGRNKAVRRRGKPLVAEPFIE